MAPKKAKPVRRDQKHGGKNGKKEGLSGSSFFTWFMVIALLGVWTSVAVVWFDLVDYEEFLGKLGDYDADGDGDFDVDDAKVLLGLKERSVSKKISEDLDETDSLPSDISDDDLEDVIKSLDNDIFDIEDALDDHEMQDDVASEFSLEDAVEPSVHGSLGSEPDVKEEPEGEPVIEEQANVEEPTVEELTIDSIIENILEQELAAGHDDDDDDDVEEATITHEDDHGTHHEPKHAHKQEVEETETEFLNAPTPEVEEPVDVEDGPEPVADEEPEEEELATEEQEPQDEHFENIKVTENQEKSEDHEESVFMGKEDLNEPAEDESDEVNDYNDQTELEEEEEEPSELSDEPYGETVPEQTEEAAPETSETDEDTAEDTEDVVRDDSEEEINDIPVGEEPSESAEDHSEEPESPHEHIEVKQNEMPEHPVVDDRPSERAEEQGRHASEGQQGEHADT
ncbi:aspartyl/asparaginyl beta-hydroxylase-like isoform X1 [Eleutherodactylus coqui]|uniref:aspartyl/asparaginyl beta-hydroxylase-like isoform X1 n=1 Tax=Eleutherodactylus coqui TaxID=57060 RepID=UPI003463634A